MKYSLITGELAKMAGIKKDYDNLIKEYAIKNNIKTISSPCFFLPPEILSALGVVSLKIPEFILDDNCCEKRITSLYDAVVISGKDCFCGKLLNHGVNPYLFNTPAGFGEDSAVALHNEIALLLKTLFEIEIKSVNIETLQKVTFTYETLRRLVRSVSTLREQNIKLLSNSELSLIFETALILPPETAIEYITPVLEEMKKIINETNKPRIRGMFYGGKSIPSSIADNIEEIGIMLIEDDTCTGRRLFDISLNAASGYIFYEILDAYSYRPLPPCMRPSNERYELLYKLLKNFNIDTVIFFEDETCADSIKEIQYLRVRMMRDGIDPLVINKSNYKEIVSGYVSRF